jgi:hypothetical protein
VSGLKQRVVVWLLVACVGMPSLQEGVPPVARSTTCANTRQLKYGLPSAAAPAVPRRADERHADTGGGH